VGFDSLAVAIGTYWVGPEPNSVGGRYLIGCRLTKFEIGNRRKRQLAINGCGGAKRLTSQPVWVCENVRMSLLVILNSHVV
jgi:hypothetical protein